MIKITAQCGPIEIRRADSGEHFIWALKCQCGNFTAKVLLSDCGENETGKWKNIESSFRYHHEHGFDA